MSTLTGAGALARLATRRDRTMLPIWIYVLLAFVASTVYGFRKLYPTAGQQAGFAATAGHSPALLALYGSLYGNTLGSLTAWRDNTLLGVGVGLMSIFIVVRHTRADEDTGRMELVGSAAVGRHAALAAAVAVCIGCNVVLGALIVAAMAVFGLPAAGALAMALAIVGCGLVFTAVAAVAAQVAGTARSARGLAIAVLGVAFGLRAVGDAAGASGPRWLTWLSPIGWTEQVRPFGAVRWWVLALPVVAGIALAAVAAMLAVRRDYDAGLLPQRPGPAQGSAWLRTPLALAWRLHRGTLIGWASGGLIYGIVIGAAAKGIGSLLTGHSIRHIVAQFGGTTSLSDAYLAAIISFDGLIAAGYGVSVVLRLRSEETSDRADPVLATGAGRLSWGLSHLVIAAVGVTLILGLTGLGAGIGYAPRSASGARELAALVGAGLAQVPAALVIAGIAAALFGLAPRASVAGAWSALGVVVLMLFLGATLSLSHWVLDVSPFTHVPKLPGGSFSATPLMWLGVIAVALAAAGLAGLRRRDIG